jgi:hypothetical protein
VAEGQGKEKVELELRADDQASASLERIKKGLKEVNEEHEKGPFGKEGKEHGEKFSWMEALKIEAIHEGADKLKEIVGEFAKAGLEQDRSARAMTGILAMTDKTSQGYDSLLQKGRLFEESLHDTSIEAGVTKEQLVGAFNTLMQRAGMGARAADELTHKMAIASAAVPGGVQALSGGFAMMEAGMVRARNPIVQLIAATGTLHGGVQAVAKAMQGMTAEQRSKIAIEAITKMSEKMEKAAPSFDSVVQSLYNFKEGLIEDVGDPIIKGVAPKLAELSKSLMGYEEQLSFTAGELGSWISKEFGVVWAGGMHAFDKIKDASFESAMNLKGAAETLTEAFAQALALTGDIVKFMSDGFGEMTRSLSQTIARGIDFFKGGDAYTKGTSSNLLAQYESAHRMQELFLFGDKKHQAAGFEAERKALPGEVGYMGTSLAGWQRFGANKMNAGDISGFSESQKNMEFSSEGSSKVDAAQQFAAAWSKASQEQDAEKAAMLHDYGARMVLKDEEFAKALVGIGDKAAIPWDEIFHTLGGLVSLGGASKEEIEELKKKVMVGPGTAGSGPIFNIGHMQITQDFRDSDPERVAIVFQRDLAKAAINRTQAMLSGAFNP